MHEYQRRLNLVQFDGSPQLSIVSVYHDDNCVITIGGTCKCDPEIRIETDGVVMWIDKNGKAKS